MLFLAWQDPVSRAWFPIGRLSSDGTTYQFVYTQGVQVAQQQCAFQPLPSFPDLDLVYFSPELFPLFANRLLRRSRPDYADFVQWLNLSTHEDDPIVLLARSGGQRATDTFFVLPASEQDENGVYHIHFFVHGLRYLPYETINRISRLQTGELLRLVRDTYSDEERGLILCTEDRYIVGYGPQYLLDDSFEMLRSLLNCVQVAVERVNPPPTPLQFRLLCHLSACLPENFRPFSSLIYQPLVDMVAASPV